MANARQLRALRKKYHLGEFRKSARRKINKVRNTRISMAKRRTKKSYRRKSAGMGGVVAIALGAVSYIVFDAIIKPFLPVSSLILSIGELAVGAWMMTSRNSFVKHLGIVAVVVNAVILGRTFVSPLISSIIPSISA